MKRNPAVLLGLQRAGFKGGWVEAAAPRKAAPARAK